MPRRKCTQKRCTTKRRSKKTTGSVADYMELWKKRGINIGFATPRTNARYKKRTTHRTSRRKTRLDYSKFSDRYMVPPGAIPVGNGLYRVVPPN